MNRNEWVPIAINIFIPSETDKNVYQRKDKSSWVGILPIPVMYFNNRIEK